jgi:hypothetical protein
MAVTSCAGSASTLPLELSYTGEPVRGKGNPFRLIGGDGMLITAGDLKSFNTMTASRDGLGVLRDKNIALCERRRRAKVALVLVVDLVLVLERQRNMRMEDKGMKKVFAVVAALLLAGCSTITPYTKDIAKESPQFATLTKADAVQIIKSQTGVSGETADYGSFILDEEGFSFKKTTEEEKTEWKDGKPVSRKYTSWIERNVPWDAIKELTPYMEEYKAPFHHIRYRVRLDYQITTVKFSSRTKENEELVLNCKTYESLVDVTAALKMLTGL